MARLCNKKNNHQKAKDSCESKKKKSKCIQEEHSLESFGEATTR